MELQDLELLLARVSVPMAVVGADGRCLMATPAFDALAGRSTVGEQLDWALADGTVRTVGGPDNPVEVVVDRFETATEASLVVLHRVEQPPSGELAPAMVRQLFDRSGFALMFRLTTVPELRCDFVSAGVQSVLGYTAEELRAEPSLLTTIIPAEDTPTVRRRLAHRDEVVRSGMTRIRRRDGTIAQLWHVAIGERRDGLLVAIEGIALDVTPRLEAERELRESEARFRSLVQHSTDLIALYDDDGIIRYVSPAGLRLLGYAESDLAGQSTRTLVPVEDLRRMRKELENRPPGTSWVNTEMRLRSRTGAVRWIEAVLTDLRDDPAVGGYVVNAHDITASKEKADALWRLAHLDSVTGVPNQMLLIEWVHERLLRREPVGVVVVGFEDILQINESAGYETGAALFAEAAARLQSVVGEGGVVGRLDGHLLAACRAGTDEAGARVLAHELREALTAPLWWNDAVFDITCPMGVAVGRDQSAAELLRDAGVAAHRAARRGKGVIEEFREELREDARHWLNLAAELRRALDAGQFFTVYQPVVSLGDGGVAGAEALVRWQHPDRGVVLPGEFIPVAEETGLVGTLGLHVLADAISRAEHWTGVTVAVNVSVHQLVNPRFAQRLHDTAERFVSRGGRLDLEVTETALLADDELVIDRLVALRDMGVGLALDDFGTLYSSLTYLRRFPFTTVKIDRSFVQGVASDRRDNAIVRSVIDLTRALGLTVVAEGVETVEQLGQLQRMGCDSAQGFLLGRPMAAHDLSTLLYDGAGLRDLVTANAGGGPR